MLACRASIKPTLCKVESEYLVILTLLGTERFLMIQSPSVHCGKESIKAENMGICYVTLGYTSS
jgi:hypothetical protein